jgi:hypothetical protein
MQNHERHASVLSHANVKSNCKELIYGSEKDWTIKFDAFFATLYLSLKGKKLIISYKKSGH